jgi:uncharacterized protein YjiS (DUF1127 family)
MSKLHQLTAVQAFGTHTQPDYRDYRHYVDKGRLLRSRYWWHGIHGALSAGRQFVHSTLATLRYQYRRQQALRELSRLDDHILLDIGIDRSRIDDVVANLLHSEQQQHQTVPAVLATTGYRRATIVAGGESACNDEPRRLASNG